MTAIQLDPSRRDGSGDEVATHVFEPETFELANGLQVIVVTKRRAPVVTHWLWYRVGCADSPAGKSGIAHFLEHLMFKGTGTIPAGEFSKIVARHGGEDNAMTSNDFTAYHQTIARDRLPLVMEMEADRMANLALKDEVVYPERDVILEERRSRVDNEPGSLLSEQLMSVQFLHQPYRLPVIGWLHEIEGYTREDAEAFYRLWYAPNNAVLVVAGDIDAAELRPLAEATYGAVPARPVPERLRLGEPPQQIARQIELKDERVRQPTLIRSYLAPSLRSDGPDHAHALEVLAELLGGGQTSRLYRSVVVEQGLAAAAACYYQGAALGETTLRIVLSPRPGVELDQLETALDGEIERFLADGPAPDELERVRRRLLADAVYARDSLGVAARAFGVALTTGGTIADVESWPQRIAAVDREGLMAAAALVLTIGRSVTGRLLPAAAPGMPS